MKQTAKRLTALVLCILVLAAAVPPARGASVYFVAVNNTLLPLESATMPTEVGGVLYVPYTVLSTGYTGVSLDVYATYNSAQKRVLVYSSQKQLIFDLLADATYDGDGREYGKKAIMRNSMVYLPIDQVCKIFTELKLTVNDTAYGDLIRIKNDKVTLNDAAFIDAAAGMMKNALARYEAANPNSSGPGSRPSTPPAPMGSGAGVYLAFVPEDDRVDEVLAALEGQDCQGLFFFTPEQLENWAGLVRRLLGEGHFIGLRTDAEDAERAAEELERGRKALAEAAFCRTSVVLAEHLEEENTAALEELGYLCWETTVDGRALEGTASARAEALMQDMTGGEDARNYLLLSGGVSQLADILSLFRGEDYQFRAPVATQL